MDLDWADLRTIELSLLNFPDPDVVANPVATTKTAIKEDGFLFLTDYGVSLEQVNLSNPFFAPPPNEKSWQLHRQFDLAQYLNGNISQEDKDRLLWDPSTGVFEGFKPRYGWKASSSRNYATLIN
jgi:isopenicillin N synthase-like dioxygenase